MPQRSASFAAVLQVESAGRRDLDRADELAFVPGLLPADDLAAIRDRLLGAFEYAETEPDPAERARLLTCVIVGGGPEGVEIATTIARLIAHTLSHGLYSIAPEEVGVVLVEAERALLPALSEHVAVNARAGLEAAGVAVRLGARVTSIAGDHVMAGGERIEARTAIWAASRCSPLGPAAAEPVRSPAAWLLTAVGAWASEALGRHWCRA